MATYKVLVVDDNADIRALYDEELTGEGYQVVTAANGEEALQIAKEDPPDAVILDIAMPVKSGLETLTELAGINGDIPVIVNTAYPLFRFDFRSLRAAAWLVKSSNLTELKTTLQKVLNERNEKSL
ncbi:MAG: response regulator [bacterium]